MDQWQQRQIGYFLIRGKYDLVIKWFCHNSTSLGPKYKGYIPKQTYPCYGATTRSDLQCLCYKVVHLQARCVQLESLFINLLPFWQTHMVLFKPCTFSKLFFMSYQSSEVSPRKVMIKLVVPKQS